MSIFVVFSWLLNVQLALLVCVCFYVNIAKQTLLSNITYMSCFFFLDSLCVFASKYVFLCTVCVFAVELTNT